MKPNAFVLIQVLILTMTSLPSLPFAEPQYCDREWTIFQSDMLGIPHSHEHDSREPHIDIHEVKHGDHCDVHVHGFSGDRRPTHHQGWNGGGGGGGGGHGHGHGNGNQPFVNPRPNNRGSSCLDHHNKAGICKPTIECTTLVTRQQPIMCSGNNNVRLICCPHSQPANQGNNRPKPQKQQNPVTTRRTTVAPSAFRNICGMKPNNELKVLGGTTSVINGWPWMIALYVKSSDNTKTNFLCGGSLITDRHVLTAAHCLVRGNRPGLYTVRAGEHDLNNDNDGAKDYTVDQVKPHPGFRPPMLYNDIGLLRLTRAVEVDSTVMPVCLPIDQKYNNFVGARATVTGWGTQTFGGERSRLLQELELPVVTNADCERPYTSLTEYRTIFPRGFNDSLMCAGGSAGRDSCQGDSGGPLVNRSPDGRYRQVGIVSFGHKCGVQGYPGVYTRLTEYLGWIAENTEQLSTRIIF